MAVLVYAAPLQTIETAIPLFFKICFRASIWVIFTQLSVAADKWGMMGYVSAYDLEESHVWSLKSWELACSPLFFWTNFPPTYISSAAPESGWNLDSLYSTKFLLVHTFAQLLVIFLFVVLIFGSPRTIIECAAPQYSVPDVLKCYDVAISPPIQIFEVLISQWLTYPRLTQKVARCDNFLLYGISILVGFARNFIIVVAG